MTTVFVIECSVPTAPSRPGHQFVDAEHIGVDHVVLDVCRYDPVSQILDENHVHISSGGIVLGPIRVRLAHPPEFDLMARMPAFGCATVGQGGKKSPSQRPAGVTSASTSDSRPSNPLRPARRRTTDTRRRR